MKKDELKRQVEGTFRRFGNNDLTPYELRVRILELLNQLDEPEVLSQELPVIPKFVAEYITHMKEEKTLVEVVYLSLEQIELGTGAVEPIDFWISRFGDKFSRAWLDGYTVEEEQKYVLKIGNLYLAEPLADMTSDIVRMTRDAEIAYRFTDRSSIDTHLEKFEGTKAVKVEELEE